MGPPDQLTEDPKCDRMSESYGTTMGVSTSDELLHQDNQIYEDPGCHKEALYSWFENGKIKKIRNIDVR